MVIGAAILAVTACGSSRPAHTETRARPELKNPSSVRAVLRFTRSIPCINSSQPLGGPAAVRRFPAVTAVACTPEFRTFPGEGKWYVYVRRVAVGNLKELKESFSQPTVTIHSKTCTKDDEAEEEIRLPVFVSAQQRTLVPPVPDVVCVESPANRDDEQIGGRHFRWHEVWVRRIRKVG